VSSKCVVESVRDRRCKSDDGGQVESGAEVRGEGGEAEAKKEEELEREVVCYHNNLDSIYNGVRVWNTIRAWYMSQSHGTGNRPK
jgi:hypothetical protein